ncbi:MAG: hypothetical protein LBK96_05015 [Prevotellaceae bacterium]|jgi:hypothetical protein|nr:hypothetical protein [Prevotellaceae bacterium]
MLEKEFKYYLDNQEELVKKYDGRTLVIINNEIVGDYDNWEDAYFDSMDKFESGTYLIQDCSEGEEAYTQTFAAPVFI